MDPTIYASFRDPNAAELAFNALLGLGIRSDDLSLLTNELASGGAQAEEADSSSDVLGVYEPPVSLDVDPQREQNEGSFELESSIGGGIETSTLDDSVSSVDEMDDSQSAAEDLAYPRAGSYGSQEGHDVREAAVTGFFNTTEPDHPALGAPIDATSADQEVTSMRVHGLGRVVGEGVLATAMAGATSVAERAGRPAADIADYLEDAGVPQADALEFARTVENGGALVAATIRPGDAEPASAERELQQHGAETLRTFGDVPEPNG